MEHMENTTKNYKNRANRLLTPKQAEEYLGIPVKSLANWRSLGKGPAYYKLGGKVRYSENDLEKWQETCRVLTADSRT